MTQDDPRTTWALSVWRAHRLAVLAFAAMWAAVAWALVTFPTWEIVECLRTGPADLKWTTIVGDAGIVAAYFWMPVRLVLIWLKLKVRPLTVFFVLFALFILFCGPGTHGAKIAMFWWPRYWFSAKVGLVTAGVSLMVAYVLDARDRHIVGLGNQRADLEVALAENERLRKEAEARAIRAEGEVSELEQAHAKIKEALARAEAGEAKARRAEQGALEHARIAEAARRQTEAAQEEKLAFQRAVKDLTTPVLPLTDRVLLTPLIGAVDSLRAAQWMDMTLEAVSATGAELVIVDLSGVPVVDTQVAAALLKTVQAVELLGGKCIITGIRPAVAQTMVDLGIDMAGTQTRSTLKAGLAAAMGMVRAG